MADVVTTDQRERTRCPECGVERPFDDEWDGVEGSHPEWCWGDRIVCSEFRRETFARIAAVAP